MCCITVAQHLFSCELNGMELRTLADCVKRLKLLEEEGRVWGQSMLLEIRGPTLLLTDIETKVVKKTNVKGVGGWPPTQGVNDKLGIKLILKSLEITVS